MPRALTRPPRAPAVACSPDPTAPYLALARALVRSEGQSQDDLLQEALFALYRALQKTPAPANPMAFATTVIRRAILHARRRWHREPSNYALSLERTAEPLRRSTGPEVLTEHWFLRDLEARHGPQARQVAEGLLGHAPLLGRTPPRRRRVHPSKYGIRRAVGLSRAEWVATVAEIRSFARRWLAE